MSEHAPHGEHGATEASNNWLGKKIARWTGHAALTVGGEFFTYLGMCKMPAAIAAITAATPAYLPLAGALALSGIGATIGWQGVKHGGDNEQGIYTGVKLAAPFAYLAESFAPLAVPIMRGLSTITTFLGMRHRP